MWVNTEYNFRSKSDSLLILDSTSHFVQQYLIVNGQVENVLSNITLSFLYKGDNKDKYTGIRLCLFACVHCACVCVCVCACMHYQADYIKTELFADKMLPFASAINITFNYVRLMR